MPESNRRGQGTEPQCRTKACGPTDALPDTCNCRAAPREFIKFAPRAPRGLACRLGASVDPGAEGAGGCRGRGRTSELPRTPAAANGLVGRPMKNLGGKSSTRRSEARACVLRVARGAAASSPRRSPPRTQHTLVAAGLAAQWLSIIPAEFPSRCPGRGPGPPAGRPTPAVRLLHRRPRAGISAAVAVWRPARPSLAGPSARPAAGRRPLAVRPPFPLHRETPRAV